MSAPHLGVGACTSLLLGAFVLAGIAQTAWFASPASAGMRWPLDGCATLRGRRLFGAHKTARGFVVMVPACAIAFPLLARVLGGGDPAAAGLWPLSSPGYAVLGAWAGFGFMLGELPNSFVKRQAGIEPGAVHGGRYAWLQRLIDRFDSPLGMLCALNVAVSVPAGVWLAVLTIGPLIHGLFSVLMFHAGIKARAA